MEIEMPFNGKALQKLRNERKLSQFELAQLTQVTLPNGAHDMVRPDHISKYETNLRCPGFDTAMRLCEALGVHPREFWLPVGGVTR
jgi:transcriptional regulator with XRE-family HTH domain